MKSLRLDRRTLLRGAGVALALPVLDAMLNDRGFLHGIAQAQSMPLPRRLFTFHFPVGTLMANWTPGTPNRGALTAAALAPTNLSTLSPVAAHVNVITGLRNMATLWLPIGSAGPTGGNHSRGTASLMTGVPVTLTGSTGPSVDQVAAHAFTGRTRLASLCVAADPPRAPGVADGLTTAHQDNVSWAPNGSQVPGYRDAHQLFTDVFAGAGGGADPAAVRLARQRSSILDHVQSEATALQSIVGADDRARLDEHLTAVRELERQISFTGGAACTPPSDPGATTGMPEDQHAKLMMRMMVLAMKCDVARCGSFQLRHGGSQGALPFLRYNGAPVNYSQHSISHLDVGLSADASAALYDYVTANWDVAMYAYFVQQLANTPEGTGTLLDNTLLFGCSEVSNGNRHNHDDMPILLAGGAGGVVPGRHLMYPTSTSVNRLYLAMLQKVGVAATSFGATTVTSPPRYAQSSSGSPMSLTSGMFEETTALDLT